MTFNQEEFNQFVLDNCNVSFLEKKKELVSGRRTNFYFSWRLEDTFIIDELSKYITLFTEDRGLHPDCFYGVPDGATRIADITNLNWARQSSNYSKGSHHFPSGRRFPKIREDSASYFVVKPKGNVIILEDTVTVGTNLLPEIEKVKEHSDARIIAVFVLTDRNQLRDDWKSVRQAVEEKGLKYFALSNALELLPRVYEKLKPSEDVARAIEEEFEIYGVEKLKLL